MEHFLDWVDSLFSRSRMLIYIWRYGLVWLPIINQYWRISNAGSRWLQRRSKSRCVLLHCSFCWISGHSSVNSHLGCVEHILWQQWRVLNHHEWTWLPSVKIIVIFLDLVRHFPWDCFSLKYRDCFSGSLLHRRSLNYTSRVQRWIRLSAIYLRSTKCASSNLIDFPQF